MAAKSRMEAQRSMFNVQNKIRQNATQLQDYLRDIADWEKNIKEKDAAISKGKSRRRGGQPGVRRRAAASTRSSNSSAPRRAHPGLQGRVDDEVSTGSDERAKPEVKKQPAAHTYDKGYKKWESFDVDQALADVDKEEEPPAPAPEATTGMSNSTLPPPRSVRRVVKAKKGTAGEGKAGKSMTREEIEKQDGNRHFKRGEFPMAIKCYTRVIALNPRNVIAYSNRAMAHLRMNNYEKAEDDCDSALKLQSDHLKSWLRRGTARNALGRHRAALRDFETAMRLNPTNKQAITEARKTREAIKSSVKRTPRCSVPVVDIRGKSEAGNIFNNVSKSGEAGTAASRQGEKSNDATSQARAAATKSSSSSSSSLTRTTRTTTTTATDSTTRAPSSPVAPLSVPTEAPKSTYEFGKVWNSLQSSPAAMAQYTRILKPKAVRKLFRKAGMEPDVMAQFVAAAGSAYLPAKPSMLVKVLDELSKMNRFSMTLMCVDDADRGSINEVLDNLRSIKISDEEKRLAVLEAWK
eukprot:g4740.t1